MRDDGTLEGDLRTEWGLARLCFRDLAPHLDASLRLILRGLLTEADVEPMYTARIKSLDLHIVGESYGRNDRMYRYNIHWQFELLDKSGGTIVSLDELTPTERIDGMEDDTVITRVATAEGKILDQIRTALLASAALQP